jgi:hypothetical protein
MTSARLTLVRATGVATMAQPLPPPSLPCRCYLLKLNTVKGEFLVTFNKIHLLSADSHSLLAVAKAGATGD